jgi:hypothetical protein
LKRLKNWAARQVEKRVRAEWAEYRAHRDVRLPLFRRHPQDGLHVSRSLIEINFHRRDPR